MSRRKEKPLRTENRTADVGRLLEELKGGVLIRQMEACKSLGRLRATQALPPLFSLFSIAPAPLKTSIIKAVGQIGDASSVDHLEKMYADPFELKLEVINALKKIGGPSISVLQELFKRESVPELKRQIVAACSVSQDTAVLQWLNDIMRSGDPELVMACLKTGMKIDPGWVIDRMRQLLVSGDTHIRLTILHLLPEVPDFPSSALTGELLQLLASPDQNVRNEAASCLALTGDREAMRRLRPSLLSDDPYLVRKILSGIRRVSDTEASDEVTHLLKVQDKQLRQDAADTLYQLADTATFNKIFPLLDSEFFEARTLIVRLFGKLEIEDINQRQAIEALLDIERNEQLIAQIYAVLTMIPDEHYTDGLIEKVCNCDISLRFKIIYEIQMAANPKSMIFLARLFEKEANEKVRAMIIATMGLIGTADDVPLISPGLEDEDPRVRANAIESLDMVSSDEAVIELIVPYLQDFNNRVKANAAMSLWNRGGLRMLALLEKMLHENPDRWHRASAAYALGEIGNLQAQKVLIDCLDDSESVVRSNIIKALGKIGDRSCVPVIMGRFSTELPEVREDILVALADLGGIEAQQLFLNTLVSGDRELRNTALHSLQKTADVSVVPDLINLLHSTSDPDILTAIIELLGSIGDERALPQLMRFFEHDDFEIQTKACDSYAAIEKRIQSTR